jgi:aminoglycoside/choline kinase family phosphotransferase
VSSNGRAADAALLVARVTEAVRACLGREVARVEPVRAALSLRRFARVWLVGEPGSLIARVEAEEDPAGRPPGIPPEPPLEPVRALFEAGGLPVPRRLGGDPAAGIELLEDVGSTSLRELARGADAALRDALYREVCSWIPRIQSLSDPGGVAAFGRDLSAAHFAYKADLFARYSLRRGSGSASPAQVACVADAFAAIGRAAAAAPQRLAHRDLQSENVMARAERGRHRLAMIDLQGALCTAPEYDLVCLLRDSYVELAADEIDRHFERTRRALPDPSDPETARHRFDCLTLTRKGKDHARFVYAATERGDDRYLPHVPATVRHLRAAAAAAAARDPKLARLAELIHALPEAPCAP